MSNGVATEVRYTPKHAYAEDLPAYHTAIREDTVVLDILAQAAALEAQKGVIAALRRVTGSLPIVNASSWQDASKKVPQGRHERFASGRHALDYGAERAEVQVRPVIPAQRTADKIDYTPRHAVAGKQQETVLLPVISRHRDEPRDVREKPRNRWRRAVAGIGAAVIAYSGLGVALAKGLEVDPKERPPYEFPPQVSGALEGKREENAHNPSRRSPRPAPQPSNRPDIVATSPYGPGITGQQQVVMDTYAGAVEAVPAADTKGVCAPALLAQAVTVSNWGTSKAAKEYNNPFGLRDSDGDLIRYTSLASGMRAQARRIVASPYYKDARFFPGQTANSCETTGRTFLLAGPTAKDVRVNLIFKYFRDKGLTDSQIAGMVGNFVRESGINPAAVQKVGGSAKGLAQWEGGRWTALQKFASKRGKHWNDLYTQLDFIWYEFTKPENRAYRALKGADTPRQAASVFAYKFERPNPAPRSIRMDIRINGAVKAFSSQAVRQKQTRGARTLMQAHNLAAVMAKKIRA